MNHRHAIGLRAWGFGFLVAAALPAHSVHPAASPAPQPDFNATWASPPAQARIIKIIHGWPHPPEAQDDLIQKLRDQGFGGVVCNVAFDQYLESEAAWQSFNRAVNAARQAGMALWLYDERGYPSGNAGGLVLRDHPEWEARGLLIANAASGPGPVELALPPGKLVLAAAYSIRNGEIDLERRTELTQHLREGKVQWQAPEGRWHVMAVTEDRLYEGTHAEGNLWQKMPYINLLMPEPTRRFLEVTHQRYAEKLGPNLGQYFVATFTDEPSLMSCFLRRMPWRPLPWSSHLPLEFHRRRGYPLDASILPALIADAGARGARIRYDFWLTVGELVAENFFGQIQERCRSFNLPSGGHLLMEEGLVAHVPLYGDFFRCARRLDAPSIDCLTSLPPEVPWHIARLIASAAELHDRPIVMCETSDHGQVWRGPGDDRPKRIVTEAEIRGTCNRLIASGVNAITSYFSFAGLADAALQRLNAWMGRCCSALAGGHQVADLAMVYPAESLWTHFRPAHHWANEAPEAVAIESTWRTAVESLFGAQRDFTVIDSRTLAEARIESGALVHRNLRWRVVVLPRINTLPRAAWDNLNRFIQAGGVIVALGALPANTETAFPSTAVQALGRDWFGESGAEPRVTRVGTDGAAVFLPQGSEGLLPVVLDGMIDRDVQVHSLRSPLRATHRRIHDHEVYFIINDSPQAWQGEVSLSVAGSGEQWDPSRPTVVRTNLGARVGLQLDPYGATILRYPDPRTPRRHAWRDGRLPSLTERPVPLTKPDFVGGQFVRGELTPDPQRSQPDRPAWRVAGQLTKSQVDTFLFVTFVFPEPIDLGDTDCLVLDTWVPEGQSTMSQMLAIVREEHGGDFIASSSRWLGNPGHQRVFVPVNQLVMAGWSKDADGLLDLRRVTEIRVGWGGYYGKHGERIEFSTTLPHSGTVSGSGRD
jgi:hypothetical protein